MEENVDILNHSKLFWNLIIFHINHKKNVKNERKRGAARRHHLDVLAADAVKRRPPLPRASVSCHASLLSLCAYLPVAPSSPPLLRPLP
jgi:hypothetical protein